MAVLRRGLEHGGLRRLSHSHLERELCQRTGRHDQQMLARNQVLSRPEQGLIERVRSGKVEGQDVDSLHGVVAMLAQEQLRAAPSCAGEVNIACLWLRAYGC